MSFAWQLSKDMGHKDKESRTFFQIKRTFYHIWFSKFETTVQNFTPCRQLVTLFQFSNVFCMLRSSSHTQELFSNKDSPGENDRNNPLGELKSLDPPESWKPLHTNIMNPKSLEHLTRYKWKRLVVCWPVGGFMNIDLSEVKWKFKHNT